MFLIKWQLVIETRSYASSLWRHQTQSLPLESQTHSCALITNQAQEGSCPKRSLGDKQSTKDKVTSNRGDPGWFRAGTPIKLALKDIYDLGGGWTGLLGEGRDLHFTQVDTEGHLLHGVFVGRG